MKQLRAVGAHFTLNQLERSSFESFYCISSSSAPPEALLRTKCNIVRKALLSASPDFRSKWGHTGFLFLQISLTVGTRTRRTNKMILTTPPHDRPCLVTISGPSATKQEQSLPKPPDVTGQTSATVLFRGRAAFRLRSLQVRAWHSKNEGKQEL
jgi:hypothetical protein